MDEVDYVATRVGFCSATGLLSGAAFSALRGLPRRATSIKVCASWTLVATAVFSTERIGYLLFKMPLGGVDSGENDHPSNNRRLLLTSHAFAGITGGGLLGYLYQRQPLRGTVVFTPLMIGVGLGELYWSDQKAKRWSQLDIDNQQPPDDNDENAALTSDSAPETQ